MRLSVKNIVYASIFFMPLIVLFYIYNLWSKAAEFHPENFESGVRQKIKFNIDKCTQSNGILYASGWAFIDAPSEKQKLFITIKRNESYFLPNLLISNREDVSKVFKRGEVLDHSGFSFSAKLKNIEDVTFTINILREGVLYSEAYTCH